MEYQDDQDLLSDILSFLSKIIVSGKNLHRSNLPGNVPKNRDEFDPGVNILPFCVHKCAGKVSCERKGWE